MDESILPTPLYFFHKHRTLRALLLDDQVWFVLDDLRRLIGHASSERLARRLEDDQLCTQWLRLDDGGSLERLLVSESGAYALLFHFAHADLGGLRRWISTQVVPEVRCQGGTTCVLIHRRYFSLQSPRLIRRLRNFQLPPSAIAKK